VKLSLFVEDGPDVPLAHAAVDAYTKLHPNVTIDIEVHPSGNEVTATRLATGTMNDMFESSSGALFMALDPAKNTVDLSAEPFIANILEVDLPTVSQGGGVYGVPLGTGMGGGILYSKKIYSDLGLSVPTTWAEFEANNEKIKAAGIAPVGQTYKDSWTAQLFVLADYYNVQAAIPDFASQFTNNKIKYATTPAALAGFKHLQEGFDKGWYQKDFGSATYDDGLNLLVAGKIAQYPMLTLALPTIAQNHPEAINGIGFFAQPGDESTKNGLTFWMPDEISIAKTSKNIDEAKKFLAFVASVEGTQAMTAAQAPAGAYVIKGASLPADVTPAVADMQTYVDKNAFVAALEFATPVKGPSLPDITVGVGSGLYTAEKGAELYDQDVAKQAQQMGLPGW
jgi:raffinose/stachyose/melibiose transport system substrate-binding protein